MAEFADLRAQVPIERVFTEMLGVTDFQKCGPRQMIGTCPLCGARALKITPAIGMGNCFNKACKMGGGVVKVVSLARKLSFSDAGDAIAAHFGIEASPKPARTSTAAPAFDPVAYQAKLDPDAEQLAPLGIASGIIREFGGGYCAKGRLGGYLALPLYDGTQITSFFGVPLDGGEIKFGRDEDQNALFNASGVEAGEPLTVCATRSQYCGQQKTATTRSSPSSPPTPPMRCAELRRSWPPTRSRNASYSELSLSSPFPAPEEENTSSP